MLPSCGVFAGDNQAMDWARAYPDVIFEALAERDDVTKVRFYVGEIVRVWAARGGGDLVTGTMLAGCTQVHR